MNTFKQIELFGFKSFADNININFDGGITAIVGPNGCGKSNIVDAIRWVLGEQSAKTLRGKSMQDVIFAGTDKRKSLSYCEVALVFDNTKRWFNIESDEVVISRKLYRSGESEYSLNRTPCRFKDITDILYDSGIGRDGYSIIGQNRVQEIIVSKPEDRRSIFEAAAGISKYKARKLESERRLERTNENIMRLNDILSEVEKRILPLKKQSEDAKEYMLLRDKLRGLEINAYLYQYENNSRIKDEINEKKKGYSENLTIKQNELNNYQIKYDQNIDEINKVDKTISGLNSDLLNSTVLLEQKKGENNLIGERIKFIEQQFERIKDEAQKYTLELEQRQLLLNNASGRKTDLQKQVENFKLQSEQISNKYWEVIDNLAKTEDETESNQRALIDNFAKLSDIKSNMSSLIATKTAMEQNIISDKAKHEEICKNADVLAKDIKLTESGKLSLENQKTEMEKENNEFRLKINDLNSQLEKLSNAIFETKSHINVNSNRRDMLVNIKENYDGYQYSVKKLLLDSKENAKLASAIMGVVGNIIEVEPKFQTAIEVALGAGLQNIVTKDETDAKTLIEYLKSSSLGRATFLPLTTVKTHNLSQFESKFKSAKGCFGIASDLIKFDKIYDKAISSLLSSTVIADNLDNAISLGKSCGFAFKIVTLEGDVLSPQGSMSGGSRKSNDSGLLTKDIEIKQLGEKIETDKKLVLTLTDEYENALKTKQNLNENLQNNAAKLQEILSNISSLNTKIENLNDKKNDLNNSKLELLAAINTANATIKDIEQKISSVDNLSSDISNNQKLVDTNLANRQNIYDELKQKREEYNEQATRIKVEIASCDEKIASIDQEIARLNDEIEQNNKLIEKSNSDLQKQSNLLNEAKILQQESLKQSGSADLIDRIESINSKIASFDEHKAAVMQEIKELDEKKAQILGEISRLENRVMQEEAKLQKVDMDIEIMQEKIYEDYKLTYSECIPFKKSDYEHKSALIEINKIKSSISDLGYVNINAIEEYAQTSERYEQMTAQMNDLLTAKNDLIKIIEDLSREMLTKFNTEFAKINENFGKVFKEIFGGGNAYLQLLESDDPLNAGVDIVAQPPGSNLKQISLLSGGELALTAISILFAILRLRPMPFCLLDEIDAALDDTNAERIAKYLQRFAGQTQFVIITHKKPTMQLADALYGVTMEEKGVSKIVSVRLDEAIKNAEVGK